MIRIICFVGAVVLVILTSGCSSTNGNVSRGAASLDSPEEMTGWGTEEYLGWPNYPPRQ